MLTVSKDVAQLPNIKKMIIPDKGYMVFDADLSGADAQVVAWDAGDEPLKEAFRQGLNVHVKNAEDVFGDEWHSAPGGPKIVGTKKAQLYYDNKRAVHATNYGAAPKTLALVLGWTIARANAWQRNWFAKHPALYEWHRRIERELRLPSHCVWNAFGFRRTYFERPDSILPEALAWIPQSTVARTCNRGGIKLRRTFPEVEMLLQVHDSLVFQIPFRLCDQIDRIKAGLAIQVPYPDPLTIQWKVARSEKSLGDVVEVKVHG